MRKRLARIAVVLIALNEIRGLILAAPVFWAMYQSGGTWVAIWLAFCSLAGIALTVLVPAYFVKKFA